MAETSNHNEHDWKPFGSTPLSHVSPSDSTRAWSRNGHRCSHHSLARRPSGRPSRSVPIHGVLLSRFGFGVSDDLEVAHANMVMMAADRPQHVSQHCDFQRARQACLLWFCCQTHSPQARVAMLRSGADGACHCPVIGANWPRACMHCVVAPADGARVAVPPRYLCFASWTLDTQQGVLRGTDSVGVRKLSQAEYQLLLFPESSSSGHCT